MPGAYVENVAALGRIGDRLRRIQNLDPHIPSLSLAWQQVIRDDNREGVLAGTDRFGYPLRAVTYRPVRTGQIDIRKKAAFYLRHGQASNRKKNLIFRGAGPASGGLLANNNLSSSDYKRLDGPPLAPRYQFSRVISNLVTDAANVYKDGEHRWVFFAYWQEVMSPMGFHFLPVHFNGLPLGRFGPSITRDLAGVRPEGRERAREVLRNWAMDLVKSYGIKG